MVYTLHLLTYLALPVGDLCVSAEPGRYTLHTDEPLPGVPPEPKGDEAEALLAAYAKGDAWTDEGPRLVVHDMTRSTPAPAPCKGISTSPLGGGVSDAD